MSTSELIHFTVAESRVAFREYFRPLVGLVRQLKRGIQAVRDFLDLPRLQREEILLVRELRASASMTHGEVRRLQHDLQAFRVEHGSAIPQIREFLERQIELSSDVQAYRTSRHLTSLAEAFRSRGELDQALEVLNAVVRLAERRHLDVQPHTWFNLGEILLERNEVPGAEHYFAKIVHFSSTPPEVAAAARTRLALVHSLRRDWMRSAEQAKAAVESLSALGKKDELALSYVQLANALIEQGETVRALESLREAVLLGMRAERLFIPETRFKR